MLLISVYSLHCELILLHFRYADILTKLSQLKMDLLTCDNLMLAEKLRNDDPEQFYTLVKMHLSFVLDLNMDE